jgi:hypothetical protein
MATVTTIEGETREGGLEEGSEARREETEFFYLHLLPKANDHEGSQA